MKQIRAAALMAISAALLSGSGGRRKLWDLDLSKFTNHQADIASQVWGVRFSPDETKVALGFGSRWNFDPRPRHVVIMAIDQPQIVLREFELNARAYPLPSESSIVWSPSGTILAMRSLAPVMFRIDGAAPCAFPKESEFGGFLSGDRMVIYFRDGAEIRILGHDCSLLDSWTIDGPAGVLDTSPEQDLLAIETLLNPPEHSAIELVAARDHKVKQRWVWNFQSTFRGGFVFSAQGRLVCSASPRTGKLGADVACWNTQSGAKTAENDPVAVDSQGIASTGGDLLAITDSKYVSHQGKFWVFLDMNDDYSVPQRRLLWNFRTRKEIASWGELTMPWGGFQQKELWGRDLKGATTITTPFVLSLSPTGKYVAEGGSGSVSVYSVQP
jgi:hypothetical protein